jgi:hypothetical protein
VQPIPHPTSEASGPDIKAGDTGLSGHGLRDRPLLCFELAGGCGELVAEVTLGLQEVSFVNLVLFPVGDFGGAAVGERGLGPVPFQCRGPGLGVVGFELLAAGGDAFALLAGSGLAVQRGEVAGEVEGVALGVGFDFAEFVDALGECGAATAGEAAELVEVVFGVGALFGGVGGALVGVAPLGFQVLSVAH